jgi:hypothetical protein
VNQVVAVIDQHPLGVFVSFDAVRVLALLLEHRLDLIGDCLDLAGVGARTKYKMVGETGDVAQIEYDDVAGLLGFRSFNGGFPKRFGGTRML